jgi:hypothetical protein
MGLYTMLGRLYSVLTEACPQLSTLIQASRNNVPTILHPSPKILGRSDHPFPWATPLLGLTRGILENPCATTLHSKDELISRHQAVITHHPWCLGLQFSCCCLTQSITAIGFHKAIPPELYISGGWQLNPGCMLPPCPTAGHARNRQILPCSVNQVQNRSPVQKVVGRSFCFQNHSHSSPPCIGMRVACRSRGGFEFQGSTSFDEDCHHVDEDDAHNCTQADEEDEEEDWLT